LPSPADAAKDLRMKLPPVLFGVAALTSACESREMVRADVALRDEIEATIERAVYIAQGDGPEWDLAIGRSRAVLSVGGRDIDYRVHVAEQDDGALRWSGGEGTAVIEVVATPGACTLRGYPWNDRVRVRLSGRELNGCGSAAPAPETN
jgi:hypothetical protein